MGTIAKCKQCNKTFNKKTYNQIYCSNECLKLYRTYLVGTRRKKTTVQRRHNTQIVCKYCGSSFFAKIRIDQKFCSPQCKSKYNYARSTWKGDKKNQYTKDYFKRNPLARTSHNLRALIYHSFSRKNFKKYLKTETVLGCSLDDAKKHIESQFKDGMTWENQGMFGWHIDHKIPLASAKTIEEVIKLCHYTNLQPLWAKDNLSKSCNIV